MKKRYNYYVMCGEIKKMGPYKTFEEASQATIGLDGYPVSGSFVWAEPVGKKKELPRKLTQTDYSAASIALRVARAEEKKNEATKDIQGGTTQ